MLASHLKSMLLVAGTPQRHAPKDMLLRIYTHLSVITRRLISLTHFMWLPHHTFWRAQCPSLCTGLHPMQAPAVLPLISSE